MAEGSATRPDKGAVRMVASGRNSKFRLLPNQPIETEMSTATLATCFDVRVGPCRMGQKRPIGESRGEANDSYLSLKGRRQAAPRRQQQHDQAQMPALKGQRKYLKYCTVVMSQQMK